MAKVTPAEKAKRLVDKHGLDGVNKPKKGGDKKNPPKSQKYVRGEVKGRRSKG